MQPNNSFKPNLLSQVGSIQTVDTFTLSFQSMLRLSVTISAFILTACSQPPKLGTRAQVSATQVDSIRAEMEKRFGVLPDTVDIRTGVRTRVVYVDTSSRDLAARTRESAFAEDSLRFDQAFDQAVWLWSRVQQRSNVISMQFYTIRAQDGLPLMNSEYFFYAKQLSNPAQRPLLDREAVGPNRSDTVPLR